MSQRGTDILGLMVDSTTLGPAFWLSLACFCVDIVGNSIIIFGYSIWKYQRTSRAQRSGAYTADMESKAVDLPTSRRGYKESSASFGDAATSTSKSSKSRRGLNYDDDDEDEASSAYPDEKANDQGDFNMTKTSPSPPRMSGDGGRSTTDVASFAPSRYEDAQQYALDSDEDNEEEGVEDVFQDAPQHVGSRGFSKRKPVVRD